MIKKDYMGLDYCTELNDLRMKLIYAKDFNPQNMPYRQQNIADHIKQCPFCSVTEKPQAVTRS